MNVKDYIKGLKAETYGQASLIKDDNVKLQIKDETVDEYNDGVRYPDYNNIQGTVAIHGMGIVLFVNLLSEKDTIDKLLIVEDNLDVIHLMSKYIRKTNKITMYYAGFYAFIKMYSRRNLNCVLDLFSLDTSEELLNEFRQKHSDIIVWGRNKWVNQEI